jgi:ATP-dependent Clp protease ATP-binding subunit ClpB
LGRNHLQEIIQIQLQRLQTRLAERNIELKLDGNVVQFLSEAGYDPIYGARPLKRAIQKELETELGRAMLAGTVREGQQIRAKMESGRIQFEGLE